MIRPIPEFDRIDIAFGNAKHLPPYDDIPEEFKRRSHPCAEFVSRWFFRGLTDSDLARLTPRDGVDRDKAMRAIGAALRSFEPKHEHKEAGCAYLLDQWFELRSEPTE